MKVLAAILLSVIMLSSGFFVNSPATAAPNENANERAKHVFKLPPNAVEIAPGIYHIGTAIHQGKIVEGIAAYHHRPGHGGGPGGGGNGGTGDTSTCFEYLARGALWKSQESWNVDPTNQAGLGEQFVIDNIAQNIAKWEDPNNDGTDLPIFGDRSTSMTVNGVDEVSPDGNNEVVFGDVSGSGAIAVTIIWGIFGGPPFQRELVEWDQMYDDVDFDWSEAAEFEIGAQMDFENIATHEIGHAAGMGHPSDTCTEETMYRFASNDEIKKRDLNAGDKAGILGLYS